MATEQRTASQRGFTVVELMIVVTIAGILLTVGAPAFLDVVSRTLTNSQARTLLSGINSARGEAIRRNATVVICPSSDGADCDAGNWTAGWLVFVDTGNSPASVSGDDEVLRVGDGPGGGSTVSFSDDRIVYDGMGFSSGASRLFTICPADDDVSNAQGISISPSGRASRVQEGLSCGS